MIQCLSSTKTVQLKRKLVPFGPLRKSMRPEPLACDGLAPDEDAHGLAPDGDAHAHLKLADGCPCPRAMHSNGWYTPVHNTQTGLGTRATRHTIRWIVSEIGVPSMSSSLFS